MKMTEKEEEVLKRRSDKLLEECWQFLCLTKTFSIEKLEFLLDHSSQSPFYNENNRLDCKMIKKWGQMLLKHIGKFEKDLKKQKQKIQKALYLCRTKESEKRSKKNSKKTEKEMTIRF